MKNIWIVGSSHGVKIGTELVEVIGDQQNYTIRNFSKSGAKFENLIWPNPNSVNKEDTILIIPFGNNLLKGYSKKISGNWHLTKYIPQTRLHLSLLITKLYIKCFDYPCKILVITNFYRLLCCPVHKYPGWLKFQYEVNREIEKELSVLAPQVKVLDHRALIDQRPGKKKAKQDMRYYVSLQYDNVHFKDYRVIASNILREISQS
jgi:hypothetical protein